LARTDPQIIPLVPFAIGQNPNDKLIVPLDYDFIKSAPAYSNFKPENNPAYSYRLVFIPEKVDNKRQFKTLYEKYKAIDSSYSYFYTTYTQLHQSIYNNVDKFGQFRDFSVGVDVVTNGVNRRSSSDDFFYDEVKQDGEFKLLIYDNEDLQLGSDISEVANGANDIYELSINDSSEIELHIKLVQALFDPFILKYTLLLTPPSIVDFNFNDYSVQQVGSVWKLFSVKTNNYVDNCHFITMENVQVWPTVEKRITKDDFGNSFALSAYIGWFIVNDQIMRVNITSTPTLLDYYNSFLADANGNVAYQYPIYARRNELIQVPPLQGDPRTLYNVIKAAGTEYLHFVLNVTSIYEVRFTDNLAQGFENPAGKLRIVNDIVPPGDTKEVYFDNVITKPSQLNNLTAGTKDISVFMEANYPFSVFGSPYYEPLGGEIANPSINRDYKYNANKVLVGQLYNTAPLAAAQYFFGDTVYATAVAPNITRFGKTVNRDFCIFNLNSHVNTNSDFNTLSFDDKINALAVYQNFSGAINSKNGNDLRNAWVDAEGIESTIPNYLSSIYGSPQNIRHVTFNDNANLRNYFTDLSAITVTNANIVSTIVPDDRSDTIVGPGLATKFGNKTAINNRLTQLGIIGLPVLPGDFPYEALFSMPYVSSFQFNNFEITFPELINPALIDFYIFDDDGVYKQKTEGILLDSPKTLQLAQETQKTQFVPKCYFTHTEDYSNPLVYNALGISNGTTPSIYQFNNGISFSYSYLLPLLTQKYLAKNNFFIQSSEISFVLVFRPTNSTKL
jgi:hypothetical protein